MLKTVEKKSKNSQKTRNEYYCGDCDYYTSRKNDYEKHILTKKHLKKTLKNVVFTANSDRTLGRGL